MVEGLYMLPRNVAFEGFESAPSLPDTPPITETDPAKLASMIEEAIMSDLKKRNATTFLETDFTAAPCKRALTNYRPSPKEAEPRLRPAASAKRPPDQGALAGRPSSQRGRLHHPQEAGSPSQARLGEHRGHP